MHAVGGYGSPHEKGVDRGERLAQQRDRNEVTTVGQNQKKNDSKKVFDIISEPRPNCSSTKIEKKMKRKQAAV
jgi:hypothetical protein